jgi:tetratricopeptide (TPR) repeat protein
MVCLVVGLVVCSVLFVRKYQMLRMLDPDTSRSTRERKLRNRIMEDRMQRTMRVHVERLVHVVLIPWRAFRDAFRRLAGKLVAVERRYHRERARDTKISPEDLQSMLVEAERALREERFQVAEERLVELISVAPKFALAYETLSRVYSARKEWKEAIESLVCYVKLVPQDAEGHFLLGSLHEETRALEKAFGEYSLALEKAGHNPKYLDAYIVTALELHKRSDAERALKTLKEVNPENAKIVDFEKTFADIDGSFGSQEDRKEEKKKKK